MITSDAAQVGFTAPAGPPGESAYQIWRDAGHTGTLQDFLAWLVGPPGPPGPQGQAVAGLPGGPGPAGPAPWATPPIAWVAGSAYSATPPASVVTYAGSSYVCATAHIAGGTFDASKWTPLALQGATGPLPWSKPVAWAASTIYVATAPASCVTYLGGCYVCTTAHTSSGAFDASKWAQISAPGTTPALPLIAQCKFVCTSATVVSLIPWQGSLITIGGNTYAIPLGGIPLSVAALTAGGPYYAYCYWTGSALAIEASATGYVQTSAPGVATKSGDPSRLLVGMFYVNAGPTVASSLTAGLVRSWYNDPGLSLSFAAQTTFNGSGSTSFAISAGAPIFYFLIWAGEIVEAVFTAAGVSTSASIFNFGTLFTLDGSPVLDRGSTPTSADSNSFRPVAINAAWAGLSEGLHALSVAGNSLSNNGVALNYVQGGGPYAEPTLTARIRRPS